MSDPLISVLCGGVSAEREVSLRSGEAVWQGLASIKREVRLLDLRERALPEELYGVPAVVFPVTHGEFGEDGQLQALLEEAGIVFAGSGAAASALCMDKGLAKDRVAAQGVPVAADLRLRKGSVLDADRVFRDLGSEVVLKPLCEGSSVGLEILSGREALKSAGGHLVERDTLVERRIDGREMTVGWLSGKALAVVEIRPRSGVYDFNSKYTPGGSEYECPAAISAAVAERLRHLTELACEACGCRDFARVDFLLEEGVEPVFLEINTLPGMTGTSLLPMSAAAFGFSFNNLVEHMLSPALERFRRCAVDPG